HHSSDPPFGQQLVKRFKVKWQVHVALRHASKIKNIAFGFVFYAQTNLLQKIANRQILRQPGFRTGKLKAEYGLAILPPWYRPFG
ncbi:MAG: hypothetical protein AAF141_07290, partial [Pseudomonadota bacterium]